jgi:hypothetical protein
MRNPYLDGINPIIAARSTGLASLRIDRNTAGVQNPTNSTPSPLVATGPVQGFQPDPTLKGGSPIMSVPRFDFSNLRIA